MAPVPTLPAGTALVVTNVNVIDVLHGGIQHDMTVVILGHKISEIRHGPALKSLANGATLLDGSGKFLIPGLWDMHQHFAGEPVVREFNLYIANGVVGVRNMGGVAKDVFRARKQIASGQVLGPQIVACGPIVDGPKPANPPISVSVHNPEEGRRTVQSLKAMGADCVKVYDGVPLDAYLAMAGEVKKVHLPLVGHIPLSVPTMQAVNAGQRSLEHQVGLRGASTVEKEVIASEKTNHVFAEAMRTKNFALIPESLAKRGNYLLDHFSQPRANELYGAFVRNGTYLVPTLVTEHALTFIDDISKQDDPRLKYIPADQREWWKPQRGMLTRYRTPAYIAFRKREFQKTLEQLPLAHRAGVMVLAGTDPNAAYVYPGFSLHDELALLVQAGLTPLQALQTATINPARFLEVEPSSGTVQPGKLANLVLLDANPLTDIHNTTKIFAVILRGKLLRRTDLDGLLATAEAAANK